MKKNFEDPCSIYPIKQRTIKKKKKEDKTNTQKTNKKFIGLSRKEKVDK